MSLQSHERLCLSKHSGVLLLFGGTNGGCLKTLGFALGSESSSKHLSKVLMVPLKGNSNASSLCLEMKLCGEDSSSFKVDGMGLPDSCSQG